jgi:deazaflavin-dependent oxidoreductase (nitroreductase family)
MTDDSPAVSERNQPIVEEFRARGGQVGGMFEGVPLLLLTHTGAQSGRRRISPLAYLRDGERVLIFASNAGRPAHPSWYHNILANPRVTVEIGAETWTAKAVPVHGEERDRHYARQAELMPAFATYQESTSRVIPVVALERT